MAITKSKRFKVFDRDTYKCRYCGKTPDDGITLEVDHVIPSSKGGSDEIENLVTACFDCNRGKGDLDIGSVAPETDSDRFRRLQELREIERSADELKALSEAKARLEQVMVNSICDLADTDTCHADLLSSALRLQREFGAEKVLEWISIVKERREVTDYQSAKYLNGIARNVREGRELA